MKRLGPRPLLIIVLSIVPLSIPAQTLPRQNISRNTWYEFLLKQFNPGNFDYGAWIEKRREAFLKATAGEPYFWYSLSVTAGMLLMMAACAKLCLDHRRSMRIMAEMMADLYSHDLYSRQAANEAIEKYNRHIEQCNRATETAEAGEGRLGWGDTQVDSLKAELQRVAGQLEATTQDRNRLQQEFRQKALVVADLSARLDALSKKVNKTRDTGIAAGEPVLTGAHGVDARFLGHINRLQEELYAERQKNKHLKGT